MQQSSESNTYAARAPDGRLWIIRDSDLRNLRLFGADVIRDRSRIGVSRIVRTLERAKSAERRRGINGHWAYDHAHARNVLSVLRNERALLKSLEAE